MLQAVLWELSGAQIEYLQILKGGIEMDVRELLLSETALNVIFEAIYDVLATEESANEKQGAA